MSEYFRCYNCYSYLEPHLAVSPAQFKELGGTSDWVELSDTLWKYRWEQAINTVKPDIVEIVTWNDYPESHYIGMHFSLPIAAAPEPKLRILR